MEIKKVIIVRFNEIFLKGGNKKYFTHLLHDNLKYALNKTKCTIQTTQNRLIIESYDENDEDEIISRAKCVFGIHSLSKASEIDTNLKDIVDFVKDLKIEGTFKCDVKRADKSFPVKSSDFCADLGEIVLKNNDGSKVDIHNPKTVIHVDIRETGKTYIFKDTIYAYSGLPLSENRDGLLLLSGGIDSPVAGFCMAKRGLRQDILHFDSFPYTSPQAKQKVITLAKIIKKFIGARYMYVCSMTKLQEEFHVNCSTEYAINLLRRSMIRVANELCKKHRYKTIITGESLGQVASQTIESLTTTNAVAEFPVLRPLISFNKEEIIAISRDIGCYETSILPYEDCCTVFLPKNPVIKPKLEDSIKEESKIDLENLISTVIDNIEIIDLNNL